jgi:hypothetical protein
MLTAKTAGKAIGEHFGQADISAMVLQKIIEEQ